ncbi:MAG TPA: hypothetical protein H9824_03795 [Candidatus Bacteroides pullicola]|uniref:Uncharacterized protein n=1 Tax=Candidatus Bacteroides pullicola TaxID=2838475 RepID=A0A9D1ZGN2_9BACE|nr:hypothetical protein [Candidatus Bacteroides pullicola]
MICNFTQISRVFYTHDQVEDQLIPHRTCILQDEDENEYLTVLHGEDAERPWHVGDEVICEMTFRVNKRHGRAYQEVVVKDMLLLTELYDFIDQEEERL